MYRKNLIYYLPFHFRILYDLIYHQSHYNGTFLLNDVGITTKFYRTYCNDVTIFLLFFSSDIHAIVEEVASLNEIDLQQTMSTLIQKWLPSASSKQQDADAVCINNNFL